MNKEKVLEFAEEAGFMNNSLGLTYTTGRLDECLKKFAELIVRQCGYYADVFSALEYPVDMDPTETKPSNYIKREMGITE
jgi:hypothetical protein